MDYSSQKQFFETSYSTGSDVWSGLHLGEKSQEFERLLSPGSMVLDLGSGRGRFPFELVKNGFKVIGLDYVKQTVEHNNQEVKDVHLESKVRFIEGDVFDIPLADNSFDGVADVGLLHHLHPEDWSDYRNEVVRVLKTGGYFLLVTFSKETLTFLNWHPKQAPFGDLERAGVLYHFFTHEEVNILFESDFEVVSQQSEVVDTHGDHVSYLITLLKKK
jgi:ubiquinone/menaquinone biosynthesis C-methylase UbiE